MFIYIYNLLPVVFNTVYYTDQILEESGLQYIDFLLPDNRTHLTSKHIE